MTSHTAMGFTVWVALKSLKAKFLAERVGFEPTIPVKVYTLSKRAPSATRPSLRTKTGWKRTTTRPYSRELPRAAHSGFRLTAPAFAHAVKTAQLQPLGHLSGAGWDIAKS